MRGSREFWVAHEGKQRGTGAELVAASSLRLAELWGRGKG